MVSYVRAAVTVAAVDGLGALIGAAAVGSSMWLAIGALTFLCAFVPLVGAIIAGVVATGVVLVTLGWVKAIIMLAVFVAVLELEGHVMQPFLLGKAVSIHPLAVLYGIAVGTIVAGIVGALFTVPLLAFGNAFVRALNAPEPVAVVPVDVPESPPPPVPFDEVDSVLTASSPDEYVP
jgi:predicted PurR-regulated permease PerM